MMIHTSESITLTPTAPFDFEQTLEYLADFKIAEGELTIAGGRLTRAIPADGQPVAFELWSEGTLEEPRLECILYSEKALPESTREAVIRRIGAFLGLGDDLGPFYRVAENDPVMAPIVQSLYGYHQVKFPTPFEAACWAVLAQRNLFTVARRMKASLVERFGSRIPVNGVSYPTFPEPGRLAAVDPDDLLAAIGNGWKVSVLRSVAEAFLEPDEELLRRGDFDHARRWLLTIDGIGDWSAAFILLRGYGRSERAPVRDRKLLETASRIYGGFLSPQDLQRLADPYGEQQGYWVHYFRVAAS